MKTFCLTLGLLMLIFCCCNTIPTAMQYSTSPGNCCFEFSNFKVPINRVADIAKTHMSCLKKGFIVTTTTKRQICYDSNYDWALKIDNLFHDTEGSSM